MQQIKTNSYKTKCSRTDFLKNLEFLNLNKIVTICGVEFQKAHHVELSKIYLSIYLVLVQVSLCFINNG